MNSATPRENRGWPAYLLGGRLRTTTVALVIAFCAIWWLYETYQPAPEPPPQVPASEVVPPGFIPDPDYTWAPRTNVQTQPPATTTPTTTSTMPTTTSTTPSTTTTSPTAPTTTGVAPRPSPSSPPPSPAPPAEPTGTASSAPEAAREPAAMAPALAVDGVAAPAPPAR